MGMFSVAAQVAALRQNANFDSAKSTLLVWKTTPKAG
jgi:hypothetical protein